MPGYFATALREHYPTLHAMLSEHCQVAPGMTGRRILDKVVADDEAAQVLEHVVCSLASDRLAIAEGTEDPVAQALAGHTAIDALLLGIWLGQSGRARLVVRP